MKVVMLPMVGDRKGMAKAILGWMASQDVEDHGEQS